MDTSPAMALYWGFFGLTLTFLLLLLVPLVSSKGTRFRTTPTRDQSVSIGLLVFCVGVGLFGVREVSFVLVMATACLSVVFQSWGPKRWSGGRVYGAYLVPLKIRGWYDDGGKVAVWLTWGCRILVPDSPANAPFLDQLKGGWVEGEGLD